MLIFIFKLFVFTCITYVLCVVVQFQVIALAIQFGQLEAKQLLTLKSDPSRMRPATTGISLTAKYQAFSEWKA